MNRLYTENLFLGYKTPLFETLNLTLREGAITCLIGRNGSGKSTLIRTLSGLLKPLKGNIVLENETMSEMSERQIAQKISVVLTEPVRIPYMTVNNLVAYGRYPHVKEQLSMTQEDTDIIECAMKDTGVFSLKERQLMSLSDGERQKAVLARAIAQQTNIILLDEPAAFLDFPSKIELMQLLGRFARNDAKTILLSTHDIEMASAIADELWVIDNQNNIITGAPKKLLDNRILSETFDISQNFLQQMFVQYQALYRNFI